MMNPGPVEEVGKATGVFMTIMKDQPLSLALVVMNIILCGLFWYVISTVASVRQKEFDRIYQAQAETNKLLFNCVPQGPRSEFKLQSDESRPEEKP